MTSVERINTFKKLSPLDKHTTENLVNELIPMGYFDAPASTKYHGNYAGGLFDHSIMVYRCLLELTEQHRLKWEYDRSPFLVAFLHDLCKADQYTKTADGWEYRKNTSLTGHGEKSLMMCVMLPIILNEEEVLCIRYHMGAFCDREEWTSYTGAIHKYPNVFWTHTVDMMASHIMGV